MLTGTDGQDVIATGNPHHVLKGGKGALPVDSLGAPWTGDYVFSSGDLVEDLTHNYFLETGARNGKLKVYETVDHPAARALTGYLLVRGGVHQVAYARALELSRARTSPRRSRPRGSRRTRSPSAGRTSGRDRTGRSTASPRTTTGGRRRLQGAAPRDRRGPRRSRTRRPRASRAGGARGEDVFAPDYAPEDIAEIAQSCARRPAWPDRVQAAPRERRCG